jgi:ribose transport system substrate-binding protein
MNRLMRTFTALASGAVLAAGAGACGGSDSGGGSSSGGAANGSGDGGANVRAAKAIVDAHLAVQPFTPPGPAFDASKARGKTVYEIPVSSNVPFNVLTGDAMKRALASVGVKAVIAPTQGQPSQWVQGMNQAIAAKADAVAILGMDPQAIGPQIKAAKDAGIPVVEDHFIDAKHPNPKGYENVAARIPAPYFDAGQLSAAYAISDKGADTNAIIVTSKDILSAGDVVTGIQAEFEKDCPACKTTVVNVPFNDWASKMQTAVQSALVKNPKANYIIPVFDGMVQFAAPAVTAAGAADRVRIASYNATPSVLRMMQEGNVIAMNSGESYDWLGYALADQLLRVLTGTAPVDSEKVPLRAFTKQNVGETGNPPAVNKGYGDAYLTGYKKLWGVTG